MAAIWHLRVSRFTALAEWNLPLKIPSISWLDHLLRPAPLLSDAPSPVPRTYCIPSYKTPAMAPTSAHRRAHRLVQTNLGRLVHSVGSVTYTHKVLLPIQKRPTSNDDLELSTG